MAQVPIRRRLPRDLFIPLALLFAWHAFLTSRELRLGWDAHAYYVAWQGSLYDVAPGTLDAYNYSPLFAQAIWPLTHLPWPVFGALFVGAAAVGIAWLVRPLTPVTAVALWLFCLPEILSGNVFWLIALGIVAGFTRGSPWCVAAFTKIVPCLGPLWFLLRGEWRQLAGFVATAGLLLSASVALDPHLWRQWVEFLLANADTTPGIDFIPPLAVRLPVGLVVLVYAARTGRRWLLPVAVLLACPIVGEGTFAVLAAIPRLLGPADPARPADRPTASGDRVDATVG